MIIIGFRLLLLIFLSLFFCCKYKFSLSKANKNFHLLNRNEVNMVEMQNFETTEFYV